MQVDPAADTTTVIIPSDPLAVRDALCALFDRLMAGPMADDTRQTAQIVLAEALNNIVEHAYATSPGTIELTIEISTHGLKCSIVDHGHPMPAGELPDGHLPGAPQGSNMALGELPEGGFGWYLIRTLSQDLHYRRVGGENLLTFRIDAKQSSH